MGKNLYGNIRKLRISIFFHFLSKHRIWPKLNIKYKRVLLRKIDNEIQNMKYISQSYLTQVTSLF
jgi:hypothetical protein